MKKTYVTTSIPYVNGEPHVGFALELVQADVIARYRRLRGEEVRLQTGADENAYKNVLSARAEGLATADFVDRNRETFRRLGQVLEIGAGSRAAQRSVAWSIRGCTISTGWRTGSRPFCRRPAS